MVRVVFYNLPLSYIHIELTTKCNAACPMCMRNLNGDRDHPSLVKQDFDIEWLDNLDLPANKLTLCGNYGDPCVHPQLHTIIDRWLTKHNKPVLMMTNGGARKPEYWASLAQLAGDRLHVVFGIDGLSDTNHLYRRHVQWDKLMLNAQAYIDAGGAATWKYIIFDHNKHQVDSANALAQQMGFRKFEKIKTNRFEQDFLPVFDKDANEIYRLYEAKIDNTGFTAKNPNRIQTTKVWTGDIDCYAKKESSVYIAADGRVYPCCNTGYHYNDDRSLNKEIIELQQQIGAPNLKTQQLSKIVDSEFFQTVQNKWEDTPLKKCKKTCGVLRDNLHAVETFS
mgnify:FL=1